MDDETHKLTRQQRQFAERTAQFAADHPGAVVVRTQVGSSYSRGRSGVIQGLGMFLSQPRRGHLIADETGIRMMQGLDDTEWVRTWREVTTVEETGHAPRLLKVDAVGFHAPKLYVLCKPTGDTLPAHEVSGVIGALRRLAGRR